MGDLTQHFSKEEFECKCGCGFNRIHPHFAEELEKGRQQFGRIKVSSGCRCPEHNAKIGGADNSIHMYAVASDIHFSDVDWTDPGQVRKVLKFFDEKTGVFRIGLYTWGAHFDKFYYPSARYWWKDSEGYHYANSVEAIVQGLFKK